MTCSEFLKTYTDFRDGLFQDPTRQVQIQTHLVDCPRCNRHDRALRFGIDHLRSEEINLSHRARVRLRVRLALAGRRPRANRSAPIAAAAAMIGIALGWGALGGPRISPTPDSLATPVASSPPVFPKRLAASTIRSQVAVLVPPAPLEYQGNYEPVSYRLTSISAPDQ